MTTDALRLARDIADLQTRLRAVERAAQLGKSSVLVNGEPVRVSDGLATGYKAVDLAAVAQMTADGKNIVTNAPTNPSEPGTAPGDLWMRRDPQTGTVVAMWHWDGSEWVSDVLADAVIANLTAGKITTGMLAAGVRIIAGPEDSTHAELTSTGLRVFADDPVDGVPNEVIRMGTTSDDYFGIVDADGTLTASIDSRGNGNFQNLNVRADPIIMGRSLISDWIGPLPDGVVGRGWVDFPGHPGHGPIRAEYGLGQLVVPVVAGRSYRVTANGPMFYTQDSGGEVVVRWREHKDMNATLGSRIMWEEYVNGHAGGAWQKRSTAFVWDADYTGYAYILQTLESRFDRSTYVFDRQFLTVEDIGPTALRQTMHNTAGAALYQGAPPPPPPAAQQQYYFELSPVEWYRFRGDGAPRTDTADVIQGYPSSNGNQHGYWVFNLPDIWGTVDRVDVYLYSNHWYNNAGGTAVLNITDWRSGAFPYKWRQDWYVGGWPKPGGRWVTVPADWLPQFKGYGNAPNNQRAMGITLGAAPNNSGEYYGRFNGADARLRIWYTQ